MSDETGHFTPGIIAVKWSNIVTNMCNNIAAEGCDSNVLICFLSFVLDSQ